VQFSKSQLRWGIELVNKYPLVFLELDDFNVPYAKQGGVKEDDYVNLRCGFECNSGWTKHIEAIAKKATEIVTYLRDPNVHCLPMKDVFIHSCIVKEKFGGLRWQGEFKLPPLFEDLWIAYYSREERNSYSTCEVTGEFGALRKTKNGQRRWAKTLCTEEAIKQGYDLENWEKFDEETS